MVIILLLLLLGETPDARIEFFAAMAFLALPMQTLIKKTTATATVMAITTTLPMMMMRRRISLIRSVS